MAEGNVLLDTSRECEFLKELYDVCPSWIPALGSFRVAKAEKKKVAGVTIPVVYTYPLSFVVLHELTHAYRIPFCKSHFELFLRFFLFRDIVHYCIGGETFSEYTVQRVREIPHFFEGYEYPLIISDKITLSLLSGVYLSLILTHLTPEFPYFGLYTCALFQKHAIDSLRSSGLVKKFQEGISHVEKLEKSGYLIGRLKVSEIIELGKILRKDGNGAVQNFLNRMNGLRGEIIREIFLDLLSDSDSHRLIGGHL
jgi:hypothetical protein